MTIRRDLATRLLWLAAITFVGIGLAFLLWPDRLAGLVEMPLATSTARADFLATYGGFQLGFGAFLVMCAARPERARLGLLATGFALGGFALGRVYGIVSATGGPGRIIYGYLVLEVTCGAVAFWAARNTSE